MREKTSSEETMRWKRAGKVAMRRAWARPEERGGGGATGQQQVANQPQSVGERTMGVQKSLQLTTSMEGKNRT